MLHKVLPFSSSIFYILLTVFYVYDFDSYTHITQEILEKARRPDTKEAMGVRHVTTAEINARYPFTPPTTGGLGRLDGTITEDELASFMQVL